MPHKGDKENMNIAVFVSGNGTNLQALIDAQKRAELDSGKITLVISDKSDAFALQRAGEADIATFVLDPHEFKSREEYDKKIIEELEKKSIELILLAGFMRIFSDHFIARYKNRILNIHPTLLPAFKGAHGIRDVFQAGVKETGVTIHFVTEELDAGPIILQSRILVAEDETLETLEEKIHAEEHKLYPHVVRLFVQDKLRIDGSEVRILE